MSDSSMTESENPMAKAESTKTTADVTSQSTSHALRAPIENLSLAFVKGTAEGKRSATPIHVDEMASRIAKFYEMIRKVVDWKEDNVLRRSAIERILKRLLFPKISGVTLTNKIDVYKFAYIVTVDLIRGGHLPNDEIPQESIVTVEGALKKYLYVLQNAQFASTEIFPIKRKINFATFLIELAACEIEEILTNPFKEQALLHTMTDQLSERIKVLPANAISDDEKKTQVFIAVCRTLYDFNDQFVLYQLLKFTYPSWQNPTPELLAKLAVDIPTIWQQSGKTLEHPLAKQFYTICERVDAVFMLLGDILDEYKEAPENLTQNLRHKEKVTTLITGAYEKRYKSLKTRLTRLAIFSTLSVFLSNWATFFIVEVPLAEFFYEGFNLFTAFIDFLVPTAVMFALVVIIRPPAQENLKRVLETTYRFLYEDEKKILYEVRAGKARRPLFTFIVAVLYVAMMFLVLGGIAWVFYVAGLPLTSVAFDTFTIALTIFAAVLIRNKSRELSVDDRGSVWEFFLDMFSVPVAKVGSFLATKWKEYNIIAILFTFLFETPFVVIVDFIENWSQYLKDRRAELH